VASDAASPTLTAPAASEVIVQPASKTSPTRATRGIDGSTVTGLAATMSRSAVA
jgi:hypothetical protein